MSTKTHNKQTSEKEQTKKRVERKSQQQDQAFLPHPADALQRVTKAPPSAVRPTDILALQSSVGNRAVQRLVAKSRGSSDVGNGPVQRHLDAEGYAQVDAAASRGQVYLATKRYPDAILWLLNAVIKQAAFSREAAKRK